MKLMGVKSNCQVLLVPNYRAFRITVIYVSGCQDNSNPSSYILLWKQDLLLGSMMRVCSGVPCSGQRLPLLSYSDFYQGGTLRLTHIPAVSLIIVFFRRLVAQPP